MKSPLESAAPLGSTEFRSVSSMFCCPVRNFPVFNHSHGSRSIFFAAESIAVFNVNLQKKNTAHHLLSAKQHIEILSIYLVNTLELRRQLSPSEVDRDQKLLKRGAILD